MKETVLAMMLLLVATVHCQNNIDTTVPILRTVSGLGTSDYFSYSMVLHQTQANPPSRQDSLDSTRIIVSAPRFSVPGASVPDTGAVWACPVNVGTCAPLRGDNTGADERLYDDTTTAQPSNVNKAGQFLGSSMASNGDYFIVCAHRFQVQDPDAGQNDFLLRGRCYYSDRDLTGFSELSPCEQIGSDGNSGTGVCTAGASALVTTDGNQGVFGVGAPGAYLWRGSAWRFESATTNLDVTSTSGQDAFSLLGYAMVAGRFASTTRRDYAVGNPRYTQASYVGRVVIVTNDDTLAITNQPLNGQQMGEYYGFSLLAANMIGDDSYDELIVGAPMYRANGNQPDTGRIFVYRNQLGALSLVRTIVGRESFSRFGYAMANLGDINGDGLDDIAVSAPFGSGLPGSVFIYYSSPTNTIMPNPAQEITGTMVNSNLSPNNIITGFGTSLASGVDVDGNTYNDLAVGSFTSQQVYLLRTRPLATVAVALSSNNLIVDVQSQTCTLRGTLYACFELTACVTYTGSGLSNTLDLTVTIFAERETIQNNLEQRIFFDNGIAGQLPSMTANTVSATLATQTCFNRIAYVQNGITDVFNGFIFDAVVTPPILDPSPTDGNAAPMDFSAFPVVTTTGATSIQIETLKNCDGQMCIPDLGVMVTGVSFVGVDGQMPTLLTVGAVSELNVQVVISNTADDAFQSTLTMRYQTNQLQISRVFNNTAMGGQLTLSCSENNQDEFTLYSCNIGNPLNSNTALTVNVIFTARPELVGNENSLNVDFTVDSVNEENAATEANNMLTQPIGVNAMADVFLDIPALVFPETVSYSNVAPMSPIVNATQLGPSIRTSFVVRNSGPSSVPTVELTINWPYDGDETGLNTFLYPTSIRSTSDATVVCSMRYINMFNPPLVLPEEDNDTGGEGQGVVTGGRRRRRRSVPEVGRKVKRQTGVTPDDNVETDTTIDRSFSCADNAATLNCLPITCTILGLQGGSSAQVEITSYLDERYFFDRNDRFTFNPTASVRIVDADYIVSTNPRGDTTASILAISAGEIIPDPLIPDFPWYAVVFPIIAVIIIIAGVAIGLYFCGFFRRAKHEEIKQKREELQNLAENGVTAESAGGDGTNL